MNILFNPWAVFQDEMAGDGGQAPAGATTDAPAPAAVDANPGSEPGAEVVKADPAAVAAEYTDFTFGEGSQLNEAVYGDFKGLAKELGLSQEQAQKIIDLQSRVNGTQEEQMAAHQQAVQAQATQWEADIKAMPEFAGSKFDDAREVASKAMALASPELRQMLNDTGLGSNPEMFKFIHALGMGMSEASVVVGGHQASSGRKSNADVFYGSKA